ncbi:MAG: glycosyltransferase family 39 protein [Bacteroidota bacterium]
MNHSTHIPFWLILASVLCVLILPRVVQDGMFMDGLLYACVSKNLSDGIGTFWFPHFSKTMHHFFNQQPPLGFGIQSVFFRIFGDSIYVERFYSFLTCIIAAYLIIVLWRILFRDEKEIKQIAWLPVLLWITIPICFWTYSNNMLENTMTIFDLLSVIFIIKFFHRKNLLLLLFAGIFIFLASLTKGFQGMFPLCTIFFGWIIYRNFSFLKMILYSLMLMSVPALIYFFLLTDEKIFESITSYIQHRVIYSIETQTTVENHLYLIYRLFCIELLPCILFAVLLIIFTSKKIQKKEKNSFLQIKKHFFFFLLVGISASVPLIVTLEQRGFYLVTSFPYYAIALASLISPNIIFLLQKIHVENFYFRFFKIVSIFLLVSVIIYSSFQIGKVGRDKEMIHDIHLIGKIVPHGTKIGSTAELWQEWSLQEYLIRHYYICTDSKISSDNEYVILESTKNILDSIKFEKVNQPTIKYHLYKIVK